MRLIHKLKSGALQFTVFVSVLIALLLSGLILYAYTFLYMKEQSKDAVENIQFSNSVINFLLHQNELTRDTIEISITKKTNQSAKINLAQWGIFEKATAVTQYRTKKFVKTAIIGTLSDAKDSPTLYLQEGHNPLGVVGTTKITGNIFLPKEGIRSGYIAGHSYYGTQLYYGTSKTSSASLPSIKKSSLETIPFYLQQYQPRTQNDYIHLSENTKITNSFKQPSKNSYSKNPIILRNIFIAGNIIIKSDTLVKICKTAILHDVIVVAPNIEIEDETTGNFQAIASRKISVGKACKLNYPSALVLYQDTKHRSDEISANPLDNKIFIDKNTVVKGVIFYYKTDEKQNFLTQIIIEEKAVIKGQVYCNSNLELKGTVSGSVYTKQFAANQAGSIFVNHIYNGTIENENIPNKIGGILFDNQPKIVMKWLY